MNRCYIWTIEHEYFVGYVCMYSGMGLITDVVNLVDVHVDVGG